MINITINFVSILTLNFFPMKWSKNIPTIIINKYNTTFNDGGTKSPKQTQENVSKFIDNFFLIKKLYIIWQTNGIIIKINGLKISRNPIIFFWYNNIPFL